MYSFMFARAYFFSFAPIYLFFAHKYSFFYARMNIFLFAPIYLFFAHMYLSSRRTVTKRSSKMLRSRSGSAIFLKVARHARKD